MSIDYKEKYLKYKKKYLNIKNKIEQFGSAPANENRYKIVVGDDVAYFDSYQDYKSRWFELKNDGIINESQPQPPHESELNKTSDGDFKKYTIFPDPPGGPILSTDDYGEYLSAVEDYKAQGLLPNDYKPIRKSKNDHAIYVIPKKMEKTKDVNAFEDNPFEDNLFSMSTNQNLQGVQNVASINSSTMRGSVCQKSKVPSASPLLIKNLNEDGLEIVDVPGDGNCFFYAVSQSFTGDIISGNEYRKLLSDELSKNPNGRGRVRTTEDIQYDRMIANNCSWMTDEYHILVLSRLLARKIRIYYNYLRKNDKDETIKFHDVYDPTFRFYCKEPIIIVHLQSFGSDEGSLHYAGTRPKGNPQTIVNQLNNFLTVKPSNQPTQNLQQNPIPNQQITSGPNLMEFDPFSYQPRQNNSNPIIVPAKKPIQQNQNFQQNQFSDKPYKVGNTVFIPPRKPVSKRVTQNSGEQLSNQCPGGMLNEYGMCMRRSPGNSR